MHSMAAAGRKAWMVLYGARPTRWNRFEIHSECVLGLISFVLSGPAAGHSFVCALW